MDEGLMTAKEVAERMRVPLHYVFRLSSEGRIAKIVLSRRCVRFRRADVEALLQEKYRPAKDDENK